MISPDIPPGPTPTSRWGGVCNEEDCGAAVFPIQNCARDARRDTVSRPSRPRTGTLIVPGPRRDSCLGAPKNFGDEIWETFTPFGVGWCNSAT